MAITVIEKDLNFWNHQKRGWNFLPNQNPFQKIREYHLEANQKHIDFQVVDRAMANLAAALKSPPANDLERDGLIQRFEYSFELIWKVSKRVLEGMGIKSHSPRSVIRDLAQQGMIEDVSAWFEFLKGRNYTSHTYNEQVAHWVASLCPGFLKESLALISKLKAEQLK